MGLFGLHCNVGTSGRNALRRHDVAYLTAGLDDVGEVAPRDRVASRRGTSALSRPSRCASLVFEANHVSGPA